MKIVDIAAEIYQEIGAPTDTSIPVIANWLRNNIGQLNNALNTTFYIDTDLEIVYDTDDGTIIEIAIEEKDIYKKIYTVHYYDIQIRKNILSYSAAPVIEVSSDGNTVRRVSATEIGKSLYSFRKNEGDELQTMIHQYKINKAQPKQVAGDDTVSYPDQISDIYYRVDS